MNENDLTADQQKQIDDFRNHPTVKIAETVHYRDAEATHLNTDWLYSDMNREGSMQASYAWLRLLTGPENMPEGVVLTEELRGELADDPSTIDGSLEFLESVGAIVRKGDSITFPNLVWGPPPVDDDLDDD